MTYISEKMREIRISKRLKQREVAERCGMSVQNYQQYELGNRNPKRETLEKIAKGLGVDSAVFMQQETDTDPTLTDNSVTVENTSKDQMFKRLMAYYTRMSESKVDKLLSYAEFLDNQKDE